MKKTNYRIIIQGKEGSTILSVLYSDVRVLGAGDGQKILDAFEKVLKEKKS